MKEKIKYSTDTSGIPEYGSFLSMPPAEKSDEENTATLPPPTERYQKDMPEIKGIPDKPFIPPPPDQENA
jgi:hypothetical protein